MFKLKSPEDIHWCAVGFKFFDSLNSTNLHLTAGLLHRIIYTRVILDPWALYRIRHRIEVTTNRQDTSHSHWYCRKYTRLLISGAGVGWIFCWGVSAAITGLSEVSIDMKPVIASNTFRSRTGTTTTLGCQLPSGQLHPVSGSIACWIAVRVGCHISLCSCVREWYVSVYRPSCWNGCQEI